jgi:hypothetical protein
MAEYSIKCRSPISAGVIEGPFSFCAIHALPLNSSLLAISAPATIPVDTQSFWPGNGFQFNFFVMEPRLGCGEGLSGSHNPRTDRAQPSVEQVSARVGEDTRPSPCSVHKALTLV